MDATFPDLPDDIEALKAALVVELERRVLAEADAAVAQAKLSADQALIGIHSVSHAGQAASADAFGAVVQFHGNNSSSFCAG